MHDGGGDNLREDLTLWVRFTGQLPTAQRTAALAACNLHLTQRTILHLRSLPVHGVAADFERNPVLRQTCKDTANDRRVTHGGGKSQMELSVVAASTQLKGIGADKNAEALDIGRDRVGQLEFTDIGQHGSLTNVGNQTGQEQNRIFDKERNGTQEKIVLERRKGIEPCSQVFRSQFALERGCGLFQNVGKFTAALVERVRRTDDAEKLRAVCEGK